MQLCTDLYTTGVADYILTVLVPELAVMLIKEDMKMCDKMARQTLPGERAPWGDITRQCL